MSATPFEFKVAGIELMKNYLLWASGVDGLVSCPGGIKDSHPFNTTETGDKRRLHGPPGS